MTYQQTTDINRFFAKRIFLYKKPVKARKILILIYITLLQNWFGCQNPYFSKSSPGFAIKTRIAIIIAKWLERKNAYCNCLLTNFATKTELQ